MFVVSGAARGESKGCPMAGPADPRDADDARVASSLSGEAGDVVQARDISGGVHFHAPAAVPAAVPHLLRADVAGFVGRPAELAALAVIARQGRGLRLAVVTGTAGVGKTSLALRFAHQVRPSFPGGDLFVDLRGYDSGPPLAPAVALERFLRALGIAAAAIPRDLEERAELYRSLLAGRRVLVVLDNAATAGQVRPLLPGDEEPLVVVTSRSRLLGLSARDGARRVSVGLLDQDSAIGLIQSVTVGYRSGDDRDEVAVLAGLCARLPLALRIAAERAAARPLMPLAELIGELRSRTGLWEALSAGEEQEADAVRTVFAWSYRALPKTAARAFRLLGLHPGPELGTGAAAALTGLPAPAARTMLEVLAGAHLLEQTGPARYQFHDLLRAFAADAAETDEAAQERQAASGRLAHWYLHSANAAYQAVHEPMPPVVTGPPHGTEPERFSGHRQAADWYGAERASLLALIRALDQAGQARVAWQLAVTIQPLIRAYGSADDRQPVALAGLRAARAMNDPAAEARSLFDLATCERLDFALPEAAGHYQDALTAYQAAGDTAPALHAALGLGLVKLAQRDFDKALETLADAAGQARATGDHRLAAILKVNQAIVLQEQGRPAPAADTAEQALADLTQAGYQGQLSSEARRVIIRACTELGHWQRAQQQLHAAAQFTGTEGADLAVQVMLLIEHADLALATQQPELAADLLWQAQNLGRPLGSPKIEAMVMSGAGQALHGQGRNDEAAALHHRAVALRRQLPDPFLLAQALSRLADTLTAAGAPDEATAARTEATGLLRQFTDPRAAALRAHLAGQPPDTGR